MEGGAARAAEAWARLEAGPLPRCAEAPGVLRRFCCRWAFPGGVRQEPLGYLQHSRPAGPQLGGLSRLCPQGCSSLASTAAPSPPGTALQAPGSGPAPGTTPLGPGLASFPTSCSNCPRQQPAPPHWGPHSQDTGPISGRAGRSRPVSLAPSPAPRFPPSHQDWGGHGRPAPRMFLEAQLSRLPRVVVQWVLPDCRLCQHGHLWSALPCPLGLRPCMAQVLTGGSVLDGYFLEHSVS